MEKYSDNTEDPSDKSLDLSALSNLDFGPLWADENARKASSSKSYNQKPRGKHSGGSGGKRDRRGSPDGKYSKHPDSRKPDSSGGAAHGRRERYNKNQSNTPYFESTVKVDIYPQYEAFDALVKRLRSTARTYQLFEIAHLVLEKPERFVVVIQNKTKKDEKPNPLYFAVPDHLPFETEDAAVNHVLNKHLELFFDIEVIEVEPPKGNFQVVNRCTITGELLGPPNYHRYQEFLKRHYASKINTMSFDQFVSKVESVKEQESIDAWIESMKKGFKYMLKDSKEGEPETFGCLESVRSFLLQNRRDAIIGSGETVRFAGRSIAHLPKGSIRRSVELYIEDQRRFPLDTANNVRGRLRRHKFTVYKKGAKGVSYVCAVKRKFRDSQSVFTNSIQEVIEFIEKHPNVPASSLIKLHLGIDTEKQKPVKLEINEAEVTKEQADAQDGTSDTTEESENAQTAKATELPPTTAVKLPPLEAVPKLELDGEDQKRLKQLMLDLRWLITEGYVIEYGDGRLFASPAINKPKPKPSESRNPVATKEKAEPENSKEPI